jgi:hypothetical protein
LKWVGPPYYTQKRFVEIDINTSGANPTIVNYNASAAKIYDAGNSLARYRVKIIFAHFKTL